MTGNGQKTTKTMAKLHSDVYDHFKTLLDKSKTIPMYYMLQCDLGVLCDILIDLYIVTLQSSYNDGTYTTTLCHL